MEFEEIKKVLTEKVEYFKAQYPISSIGLFGSIVRDDFTDASDIDIIVDFHSPIGAEFITLADELEKLLGRKVDLVSRGGIKEQNLKAIDSEIIYI